MTLTTISQLVSAGLLDADQAPGLEPVAETFRVAVTEAMARPELAAQFVPTLAEMLTRAEELSDPIGDHAHAPSPGLTHRYPDRVILHATQTCEVYCRFCFRRESVGASGHLPEADLTAALDHIAATPAIREVILTGGDPMVLSPRRLGALLRRLDAIPNVDVVRFHTRVPVVNPARITDELIAALDIRPAVWVVVHTNHPAEITPEAEAAFRRLTRAGVPLLSQSVLLKGVNADPDTLEALFRALIRNRVKPYYLHHADLAKGTSHFRTTIAEGQKIMETLRGRLSGIAQPTYVLDIPGGHGKVPIGPGYLEPRGAQWQVTDPRGQRHAYADVTNGDVQAPAPAPILTP
ncbi:lysine-2,3-aminomutase-like protein [Stagnihabitans tardus]|uniref:Lysine-2,3-aminomutase-like protein n=1 Tax=Stagnihabitans tardus TaxID=2699202 RepID=A0AAE5BXN5_9RHOB|nr:lysine-2,3-aminomutase-like protein [Stagnihabitans tardus]NBZ89538.1 lysine-2,3-aminomutase-like protein [Stagnihabitans tardus]